VHERFLARLANSRFAERLVLKGGMLLAALDARRATRDADMLPRGIDNDMESLRDVVSEITAIELTDGVVFDVERISLVTIREDAKYEGIRVVVPATLGGAVLKLRLDCHSAIQSILNASTTQHCLTMRSFRCLVTPWRT
jgi:hypothetical protein